MDPANTSPTPPPVLPPTEPQHVETGPKYHDFFSKKIWVLLVVFLFLGAAAVVGAYYVFTMQFRINKETAQRVVIKQLPPVPSPTPDPMAGWRTYTNTLLGFSFKYPSKILPNEGKENVFNKALNVEFNQHTSQNSRPGDLYLTLLASPSAVSVDTYISQQSEPKDTTRTGTVVGSKPAIMLYENPNIMEELPNVPRYEAIFENSGVLYVITLGGNNIVKYKTTYDQILSTFKFTRENITATPSPTSPYLTPTCFPRPACLDATPRCMIAEPAGGWCPTP